MISINYEKPIEHWAIEPLFKSGEISLIRVVTTKQSSYPVDLTPSQMKELEFKEREQDNQLESEIGAAVWATINRFNYEKPIGEQGEVITLRPHEAPKPFRSLDDLGIWIRDTLLQIVTSKRADPVPIEKYVIGISLPSLFWKFQRDKNDKLIDIASDKNYGVERIKFSYLELKRVLMSLSDLKISIVLLATAVDEKIINLLASTEEKTIEDLVHNIYEVDSFDVVLIKNSAIINNFTLKHVYQKPPINTSLTFRLVDDTKELS